MKNIGVKFIFLLFSLLITSQLCATSNSTITDKWEKDPQYPEYLKKIEAGDITAAMGIKKTAISEITKEHLKSYLSYFKPKYRTKYLSRFQEFPLGLRDLTSTIHEKLSPMVKDKTVKGRNAFAKSIYDFINHYNKEDGKAEKYARKLLDKVEGGQSSPIADLIINMGKQSDIEAAKSPEQKKREYEKNKQTLEKNKQTLEKNKQELEKRNEIINRLKSILTRSTSPEVECIENSMHLSQGLV